MSTFMQSLGINRLSRDDRLTLVQEIWDSIAAEPLPLPLTEAQRRELDRRLAERDADPDGGTPWEVVRARTLARLKKPKVAFGESPMDE